MSFIDSDLEEGEIPDDSPSSSVTVKKGKELPRRYILGENKGIHKHKKDCKYAIRYHAKKLSKLKKTPSSDAYKKHHKSCTREKYRKRSIRYDSPVSEYLSKNNNFSKHSLISEMKGSFKDLFINKQNLSPGKSKSEILHSKLENKTSNDSVIKSETVGSDKNSQSVIKDDSVIDSQKCGPYLVEETDLHLRETSSNNIKDSNIISHDLPKEKEESEDEEELRRIALATCARTKSALEPSENLSQSADSNYISSVPVSSKSNNSSDGTSYLATDNYEVVDMEVEDIENSGEIIDNEGLFVIDTKPLPKFEERVENSLAEVQNMGNSSDEDFKTDILRAELIGNMFHKRAVLEQLELSKTDVIVHDTPQMPIATETKFSASYQKQNVNLPRRPLQMNKHILRKNGVNKSENFKSNSNKLTLNNLNLKKEDSKSQKRLIITLNGESSSDESDGSEEVTHVPEENPVASIEALISDCRQKSNSNGKTDVVVKQVPKALSCLSKAQQEEYNSLLKILAEKKKLLPSQETIHRKNGTVHSPLDDLKLLEKKLLGFKETLKKKKMLMSSLSKEEFIKKHAYMKSKLSAQHLKEQYVAAEKVRRIKLDAWSKTCQNFKDVKSSVSILESKIIQFQNLCSKVGSSIQGLTYNLPS